MKRSDAQTEASRRNGAKSRGPVTLEGKMRSGQRIAKIAHSYTLNVEDKPAFLLLHDEFLQEHQPVGFTECLLVEKMAIAVWRQQRNLTTEKVSIDLQVNVELAHPVEYSHAGQAAIANACRTLSDESRCLSNLNQNEARLDRQFYRALNTLLKLQDRRNAAPVPPGPVLVEPPEAPAPDPEPDEIIEPEEPLDDIAAAESDVTAQSVSRVCFINAKKIVQPTQDPLKTKEDSRVLLAQPAPIEPPAAPPMFNPLPFPGSRASRASC